MRNVEMEIFVDEEKPDDVVIHIKMVFFQDVVQIQWRQGDRDVPLNVPIDHF